MNSIVMTREGDGLVKDLWKESLEEDGAAERSNVNVKIVLKK